MAKKLFFMHGVMNAGKSLQLLTVAHNYREIGGSTIIFTSARDDRAGVGVVRSRLGVESTAVAVSPIDDVFEIAARLVRAAADGEPPISAVLVDEVQFFTVGQIEQFARIVDELSLPVMAYGLKNNAFGSLFGPAVEKLLALADEISELKTVCHCGRKANMILRHDERGAVDRGGDVVVIGGNDRYVSVCRSHWKAGDIGDTARRALAA